MESKTGFLLIKIIALFLVLLHTEISNAQNISIVAKVKNECLKVTFVNNGERVKVPDLSVRFGLTNGKERYLFEKYYKVRGDTLFITLKEKVHTDLYTIRTYCGGKSTGAFYYNDVELEVAEHYKSKVKIKLNSEVSILRLRYKNLDLQGKID